MRPLVLSLIFLTACAPRTDADAPPKLSSITVVDSNGFTETISSKDRLQQYQRVDFSRPQSFQKVLRVYTRDAEGNVPAYLTSYHQNGQLKQYLEARNNAAFGPYREWYPSGVLKLEAMVISGNADLSFAAEQTWLFDGMSRVWDENGSLAASIHYSKGVLDGPSLYYHPTGTIWKRIPYEKGQVNGIYEVYLENGQRFQTTPFKHGAKQGTSYRYWPGGLVAAEEHYEDGLLMRGSYHDRQGKAISKIVNGNGYRPLFSVDGIAELQQYSKGIQEGLVKVFDGQGNLINTHHIVNGEKHGEEIEYQTYLDSVKPKLSLNWFKGAVQGVAKTWYDNGALESQREMSQNRKNGLLTAWYKDGSLMMIEEYDQDQLVRGEYYKKGEKFPISEVLSGSGLATLYDAEGNFARKVTYHQGKPQE